MLTLACWLAAADGLVYLVSSATGCTDWVDIGEQSYSMALLDDLDGNGYMDLMVTTMNGNAFALQTEVAATPQAHWLQQVQCGANGATWGVGYHGVHVLPASRVFRDVVGASVQLSFEVR